VVLPATHPVLKRENATIVQSEGGDYSQVGVAADATTVDMQEENVMFTEEDLPEIVSLPSSIDTTRLHDEDTFALLADYLSRPVKIDSFLWNESDVYTTTPRTLYPWQAYFTNTYIKRKLDYFARIQCTLKVTIRFNASPFYYGQMRVAYDPLNTGRLAVTHADDRRPWSQAPGVWIEPQNGAVVELDLPFFWPNTWLDATNTYEFKHMGALLFQIFTPLRSANGVSGTGISVTTYVTAHNVTVSGLTLKSAVQAGVISGPATTMAGVAKALTNTPVIGKFARAAEVGLNAVSSIARMFGFSNPPIMDDVHGVHPKAFHAFANIETSMPLDKLAVDPKNEVTIDPSVTGISSKDELTISDLAGKSAWMNMNTWEGSDLAGAQLLMCSVTPYNISSLGATNPEIRMTPLGWIARMFDQWRGSVIFNIKLVKSKYHKGRLLVTWDPTGIPTANAETALFTKIIDLATDTDEYEFVVPYKATSPWLLTTREKLGVATSGGVHTSPSSANGVIGVFVLNSLTGPAASPEVDIHLYMKGGPDIQFSIPHTDVARYTAMSIQSGIDGGAPTIDENLANITVGESIASLRTLLHRTTLGYMQPVGSQKSNATNTYIPKGFVAAMNRFPRLPPEYGFDSVNGLSWAAKTLSTGNAPFNFTPQNYINSILWGFAGYRGSMNIHANVITPATVTGTMCSISATRTRDPLVVSAILQSRTRWSQAQATFNPSTISAFATVVGTANVPYIGWGLGGKSLTNANTQSALSVNVPQYDQFRFEPAWAPLRGGVPTQNLRSTREGKPDNVRIDTLFLTNEDASDNGLWPILEVHYGAGVDFTPLFFVGIPTLRELNSVVPNDSYQPPLT